MTKAWTAVLVTAALTTAASAEIRSFIAEWSGAGLGNQATATAQISIDDALLNNPGSTTTNTTPGLVTAFSITVSGSTSGDGIFDLSHFHFLFIDTGGGVLDLTQELVGQPTSGTPWGTPGGNGGDFNMFANGLDLAAPTGSDYFQLSPAGSAEAMVLTSFRPVPAPGAGAMLGLAKT